MSAGPKDRSSRGSRNGSRFRPDVAPTPAIEGSSSGGDHRASVHRHDDEDDLAAAMPGAVPIVAAGALVGASGGASGGGLVSGGALASGGGLGAKVLVLNRLYMALRVIGARRAFTMLARDLAEVIHVEDGQMVAYDFTTWAEISQLQREFQPERHDWVRTVRVEIAVPKVIRLLGYDRLPEQQVKLNRRNLFARDRNQCQYCGRLFPTSELSVDHVRPRAQGGGDTWENLVCACVRCNARKGGRTPEQASMTLIRRPVRPKRNPLISMRLGQQKYESWKTFLDHAYWSVELR